MKICVFGNKLSTKKLINHLIKKNISIDCIVFLDEIVANKVDISGKYSELSKFLDDHKISYYKTINYSLKDKRDYNFFNLNNFDLGLCTGWQRLIPKKIIKTFRYGIFGWHGSGFQFPNGRGRSPLNWSIRLGLKRIYHNCFRYSDGVDDGDIFETKLIFIKKNDYIDDLQNKALNHTLLSSEKLISAIKDKRLKLVKQTKHPYIKFPKLTEKSGKISPQLMNCSSAINLIRSCSKPFPGAFIEFNEVKYRIWKAIVPKTQPKKKINDQIFIKNKKLFIKMRDGFIECLDYEKI